MKLKKLTPFHFYKLINKYSSTKNDLVDLLLKKSTINSYRGIELDLENIYDKNNLTNLLHHFPKTLDYSLEEWSKNSIRSITVRIPSYLSTCIPSFMDRGFYFHHTTENNLYLCKWLDHKTQNKIPKFAHHHVGIGACIITQNLEFLLIKEKYIPSYTNNRKHLWKFVTGLIEEGESVIAASHREIREEVNLEVDYHGCLQISETFPNSNKISDLCFFSLCSIKDEKSFDRNKIDIDKDELSEAKIFNLEEVKTILSNKDTTLLTQKTFEKLIPLLNFNKNLEENLKTLKKESNLFTPTNVDIDKTVYKINYLNVYH